MQILNLNKIKPFLNGIYHSAGIIYSIPSQISRHLPFPFRFGPLFSKCYFWVKRTQWYSENKIRKYQDANLRKIVLHAYSNVPYYKRLFDQRGLRPKDVECKEDLRKLPYLTKELVRRNFKDLVCSKSKDYIIFNTSGSTGTPLGIRVNIETYKLEFALYYRFMYWAGYRFGSRVAQFWVLEPFLKENKRYLYDSKSNKLWLNPLILSEQIINEYISILSNDKFEFLIVNPSILNVICNYLQHREIKNNFFFKAIITSGTTLYPELREKIQNQFQCPVFDWYNHGEHLTSACECEKREGYHVNFENAILETPKDKRETLKTEFILTTLTNTSMPLIRYRIEDEGEVAETKCSCGRETVLLKSIYGKRREYILTKSKYVYGHYLYILIQKYDWVYQAQFFQEEIGRLQVRVVKMYDPDISQISTFLNALKEVLGSDMKIEFNFVDDAEITRTGKRHLVISKALFDAPCGA
jgi:phenylacetate-CoA ligase